MKLQIKSNDDGALLAEGEVKRGKVSWKGESDVVEILEAMPIPPTHRDHAKYVEAYFSRSTTMSLYKDGLSESRKPEVKLDPKRFVEDGFEFVKVTPPKGKKKAKG